MTTEQELNETLARFVGWEPANNPPDFTHDIKACLDILGPKFKYWSIEKLIDSETGEPTGWYDAEVGNQTAMARTEAMAFSLAAEQAIEKGAKP